MDMITLRRRMMVQMAKGVEVIKGSFTAPDTNQYKISFGKTINKYLYIVEMVDASKTTLLGTGQTSAKMYACCGTYPIPSIGNETPVIDTMSYRIIPSTGVVSYSAATIADIDNTGITFTNNTIGNGSNVIYRGYTYNYVIVSLDDV